MLDDYPEKKKELRSLKKELATLFDLDIDKWCFEMAVSLSRGGGTFISKVHQDF